MNHVSASQSVEPLERGGGAVPGGGHEPLHRGGSLHGDDGEVGTVCHDDAEVPGPALEPAVYANPGGRVGHHAEPILKAERDDVVDDAAVLVQEGAIECLARRVQPRHVVGDEMAQEGLGLTVAAGAVPNVDDRHVRHVEGAGVGAHGAVLFDL